MASFDDNTVIVVVNIDVRGPNTLDFDNIDETDLGGGLVVVNVQDSGYLINLKAVQEQCPAFGVDDDNASH